MSKKNREDVVAAIEAKRETIAAFVNARIMERNAAYQDTNSLFDLYEKERPIAEKLEIFNEYRRDYLAQYSQWRKSKAKSRARYRFFEKRAKEIANRAAFDLS